MMADCPDKYETRSITGVESPGLGDYDSSSQAPDYHDDHRLVVDELKGVLVVRSQPSDNHVAALPPPSSSPCPTELDSSSADLSIASTNNSFHDTAENNRLTLQIVGGTLCGVILVALSLVLFFLYQRRRGRKIVPYATGPLQVSLPMSKEAFTSKRHSLYGLSFSTSAPPSTDLLITLPHNSRESRLGSGSS